MVTDRVVAYGFYSKTNSPNVPYSKNLKPLNITINIRGEESWLQSIKNNM